MNSGIQLFLSLRTVKPWMGRKDNNSYQEPVTGLRIGNIGIKLILLSTSESRDHYQNFTHGNTGVFLKKGRYT